MHVKFKDTIIHALQQPNTQTDHSECQPTLSWFERVTSLPLGFESDSQACTAQLDTSHKDIPGREIQAQTPPWEPVSHKLLSGMDRKERPSLQSCWEYASHIRGDTLQGFHLVSRGREGVSVSGICPRATPWGRSAVRRI